MSEKLSLKDIASRHTPSVSEAFADQDHLQAEKDWADYLAHSRKTQGYLMEHKDGTVSLRNGHGDFKAAETDQEHRNRLYDQSLENTSRENMGLSALAKAAREARESGDKTTQLTIEDEIQEKLISEAEKYNWTEHQRNRMLDLVLKVMDGEAPASISEEGETEPVEVVAEEEVAAQVLTSDIEKEKRAIEEVIASGDLPALKKAFPVLMGLIDTYSEDDSQAEIVSQLKALRQKLYDAILERLKEEETDTAESIPMAASEPTGTVNGSATNGQHDEAPAEKQLVPLTTAVALMEPETTATNGHHSNGANGSTNGHNAHSAADELASSVVLVSAHEPGTGNGSVDLVPVNGNFDLSVVEEHASDSNEDIWDATFFDIPDADFTAVDSPEVDTDGYPELDIDTLIKDFAPHLYDRYDTAREAYIDAHVNDRFADMGGIANKFVKKGGRLEQIRNSISARLKTGGHRRREALSQFEPEFIDALNAALRAYPGEMTPENMRRNGFLLQTKAFEDLETEISRRKIEKDGKKSAFSRKVVPIIGAGAAVVGGAGWAVANHAKNGGDLSLGFLAGAAMTGAAAGFAAEKASRTNKEADTAKRIQFGKESLELNYNELDNEAALKTAVALGAIEGNTNLDQDRRLGSRTTAVLAGAALAGAAYGLTNRAGASYEFYNDTAGTDLNPLDGDGVDVWDGDGINVSLRGDEEIDVFPTGDNPVETPSTGGGDTPPDDGGNGNGNENTPGGANEGGSQGEGTPVPQEGAGTPVPQEEVEAPAGNEADDDDDSESGAGSGSTDDERDQEPVGSSGDSDGDGEDEPAEAETADDEAEFDGTNINIQANSSITQEFQEYVRDEYNINLTDEQARDMYRDFKREGILRDSFSGVEFFEMDADPANGIEQGDLGLVDTGPAEITAQGEAAIADWLTDNNLPIRGQ